MSLERGHPINHGAKEPLSVQANSVKIDWDLFIYDVAPPTNVRLNGDFLFCNEVKYASSRIAYPARVIKNSLDLEINCD